MGDSKESHGIPQFNGSGFDDWQFRVKLNLDSLGLLDVLTGVAPVDPVANAAFMKNDKKAKDRLVGFLHSDCLCYVRDKNTSKEMWESLQSVFAKKSVVNQLLLRKKLSRMRMNDGDNVTAHVMEFENLIRQLKMAGATIEDADLLAQFFLTLPEKYDPLVTALQNVEDGKLTFNLVKERLMSEEAKISDRHDEDIEEKMAFVGKENTFKKFNGKCFKCNRFGHQARDCRSEDERVDVKNGVSFVAKRNFNGRSYDTGQYVTFKLDSGASDHLCHEKWCFKNLRELKEPIVIDVAKNNQSIIAKYYGEINGVSDKGIPLFMKNVLYTPDLRDNLLSVRKLTKAGVDVEFVDDKGIIQKNNEVIAIAKSSGSLYEIKVEVNKVSPMSCDVNNAVLCHRRLGHVGESDVQKLMKAGHNPESKSSGVCNVCSEVKQRREAFDGTRARAREVKFEESCFPCVSLQNQFSEKYTVVPRRHEQEGESEDEGAVSVAKDEGALSIDENDDDNNNLKSEDAVAVSIAKYDGEDDNDNYFLIYNDSDDDDINITSFNNETVILSEDDDEDADAEVTSEETPEVITDKVNALSSDRISEATPEVDTTKVDVRCSGKEVLLAENVDKGLKAVNLELESMDESQACQIVEAPKNTTNFKSRWKYRIKDEQPVTIHEDNSDCIEKATNKDNIRDGVANDKITMAPITTRVQLAEKCATSTDVVRCQNLRGLSD